MLFSILPFWWHKESNQGKTVSKEHWFWCCGVLGLPRWLCSVLACVFCPCGVISGCFMYFRTTSYLHGAEILVCP